MPLQIPEEELEAVARVVSQFPEGVSISELMAVQNLSFSKRTLQRRLDQLIVSNRIKPRGEGRGRRYLVPVPLYQPSESKAPVLAEVKFEGDWQSPEGKEIEASITRPLSERTPVGYRAEFLERYEPNVTTYLPPELRSELAAIGKVGMSELPAGTYLRQVLDRLLIDLSWNSSRLEGNTYSLLETQRLLERGEMAEGKATEETQMILNHKAAIEMLADEADEIGFNHYTICNLHAVLADNLLPDLNAIGQTRSRRVGIGGSVFRPLEGPDQIAVQFRKILEKAEAIDNAFEKGFFVMVHLPYLQPFEDVNKRTSRLAANIPLIQHNLCPLSFVEVDPKHYINGLLGVYELNRIELLRDVFVYAYRKSCARYGSIRQSVGQPNPFRLRHRTLIGECVRDAVLGVWSQAEAPARIRQWASEKLPESERTEFGDSIEAELDGLHIGSIARYRLRPSEFESWRAGWK